LSFAFFFRTTQRLVRLEVVAHADVDAQRFRHGDLGVKAGRPPSARALDDEVLAIGA
jgi:hypothetical protein